jgi:hypothetical protein
MSERTFEDQDILMLANLIEHVAEDSGFHPQGQGKRQEQ